MPKEGLKCSHSAFPPLSPLEVLFFTAGITAAGGETRLKAIPPPPPHQSFGRAKGGKEASLRGGKGTEATEGKVASGREGLAMAGGGSLGWGFQDPREEGVLRRGIGG